MRFFIDSASMANTTNISACFSRFLYCAASSSAVISFIEQYITRKIIPAIIRLFSVKLILSTVNVSYVAIIYNSGLLFYFIAFFAICISRVV